VLYRAIEREPRNRYPSAHAFARDLEYLDQVGVADRSELANWNKRRRIAPRKFLLYSALALVPILLFLLMLVLSRNHG